MTRELKFLNREIDMLERFHQRLGIMLEQKLVASPINMTEAQDIIRYQQLILNKLNHCKRQAGADSQSSQEGFSTHLSIVEGVLMDCGVVLS